PHHLTSIEQDGLPSADDLEQLLAQLAWPETVDGAAVVVERIVVPPEAAAEADAMTVEQLMEHPQRQDVRIAVGVLRTGESWCALRTRAHDSDDAVGGSPTPSRVSSRRCARPSHPDAQAAPAGRRCQRDGAGRARLGAWTPCRWRASPRWSARGGTRCAG